MGRVQFRDPHERKWRHNKFVPPQTPPFNLAVFFVQE